MFANGQLHSYALQDWAREDSQQQQQGLGKPAPDHTIRQGRVQVLPSASLASCGVDGVVACDRSGQLVFVTGGVVQGCMESFGIELVCRLDSNGSGGSQGGRYVGAGGGSFGWWCFVGGGVLWVVVCCGWWCWNDIEWCGLLLTDIIITLSTHTHTHICAHTHVFAHTHTYVNIHTCTHTQIHTYTHTHPGNFLLVRAVCCYMVLPWPPNPQQQQQQRQQQQPHASMLLMLVLMVRE